jgi:transcriptional regulator with XRE-family HTH domain
MTTRTDATRRAIRGRHPIPARELARREQRLRAYVGRQIADIRAEAGVTQAELAKAVGIDQAHICRIEAGLAAPSLATLVSMSACLGNEVGVRLFPAPGPRLVDRFQAPMVETVIRRLDPRWHPAPEVVVPAARGVIDLVLSLADGTLHIACECHSELRRLELVIRRSNEKALGLEASKAVHGTTSRLLVLRSTERTRAIARVYEATLAAAFPARTADAVAALITPDRPWPGPAVVWVRLDGSPAELLDGPPRGVRLGR